MLDIEFAHISDLGPVRLNNEDYLGHYIPKGPEQARSHGWLFVLADGVGGNGGGEIASQTAVETVLQGFADAKKGEPLPTLLQRLGQSANHRVFETALHAESANKSMATTLVACALRYDRAIIAHVGDSRCYLVRDRAAKVLTRDHTVSSNADTRHVLTRSLGGNLVVSVDIADQQILPGDVLLLCSDGLHGSLKLEEIAKTIHRESNLDTALRDLVALAMERDGSDNASAQLIRVRSVERMGMYRGRHYKLR